MEQGEQGNLLLTTRVSPLDHPEEDAMKKSLIPLLLLALAALLVPAARAQDEPPPRTTEAPAVPPIDPPICIDFCPPPVWNMDGLEIPYQRVEVTIADQVATTHVEQLFRNPNDWMLEGTYLSVSYTHLDVYKRQVQALGLVDKVGHGFLMRQ